MSATGGLVDDFGGGAHLAVWPRCTSGICQPLNWANLLTVPRVSILMPAFNAADTIEAAIGSVLAQTSDDWELIVGDDASTDDTAELALGIDERIRVVSTRERGGPAKGRNFALELAQGEFIALLDADDRMLSTYLASQVDAYDRATAAGRNVGLVTCDAILVGPDEIPVGLYSSFVGPAEEPLTLETLLVRNKIFISVLMPRRLASDLGGFSADCFGTEDYDMWLRIVELGYEVVFNPEPLVEYQFSDSSITVSRSRIVIARASQAVFRRALDRGFLSRRERRIARSSLRFHQVLERAEEISLRRASGATISIADVPNLLYVVGGRGIHLLTHPRRWSGWIRAIAKGSLDPWRALDPWRGTWRGT